MPGLKNHPDKLLNNNSVFTKTGAALPHGQSGSKEGLGPLARNLVAYDGISRLYIWNRGEGQLHAIDVEKVDNDTEGGRLTYLASYQSGAQEYQTLKLSCEVSFEVGYVTINRPGRLLALVGDSSIVVVDVIPKSLASSDTSSELFCRATLVGNSIEAGASSSPQKISHVMWHPFSEVHLGVLYSKGVFELVNLAVDKESPEQTYYLWLEEETGFLKRPVTFSFGSDHLWLRFTIFFIFTDGSIYILCPVVPFGSRVLRTEVDELARHAEMEMQGDAGSPSATADVSLSQLWLDNTFPDSNGQDKSGTPPRVAVAKACGFSPTDTSLSLQGPLQLKAKKNGKHNKDRRDGPSGGGVIPCRPTSLLHSLVGSDCLLSVTGRDGKVYLFVLVDEVAPHWQRSRQDLPSAIETNASGHVTSMAMAVGPYKPHRRSSAYGFHEDEAVKESAHGPLLFLWAEIDLALDAPVLAAAPIVLVSDPVVSERMYCCHAAGIDAIEIQWPPPAVTSGRDEDGKNVPEVHAIIDFTVDDDKVAGGLLGMALVTHGTGEVWVVGVTESGACITLLMQPKGCAFVPRITWSDGSEEERLLEPKGTGLLEGASADILQGPKSIPDLEIVPDKSLSLVTVEGRKYLHSHCKLLHEKYVEYAHRVYVELGAHGKRLDEVVAEQVQLSQHLKGSFQSSQAGMEVLTGRLQKALETNRRLEERVRRFSQRPAVSRRPLTAAERDCKAELAAIAMRDMDLMQLAVDELSQRAQEYVQQCPTSVQKGAASPASPSPSKVGTARARTRVPDSQMRKMRSAVEQLSDLIQNMVDKVKVLNNAVVQEEGTVDR